MSLKYSPKELSSKLLKGERIDIDLCTEKILEKTEKIIDKWALNLLRTAIRKDFEGT